MDTRDTTHLAREMPCGIAIGDVVAVPAGRQPTPDGAAPGSDMPDVAGSPPGPPTQRTPPAPET